MTNVQFKYLDGGQVSFKRQFLIFRCPPTRKGARCLHLQTHIHTHSAFLCHWQLPYSHQLSRCIKLRLVVKSGA